MSWTIRFSPESLKDLKGLDRQWAKKIVSYLQDEIAALDDPTSRGKRLRSELAGLHRYRLQDYRIVCEIQADEIIILVVRIAHRSVVYE